ncbi:CNNM domain-containing protein [Mycoplasmopsis meleagridis]|uniref:CNNM domain-containing protein n=1 Tax=Mycoplasmopsis meleagridis TaxID=29561 RepID=UPI00073D34DE|nr:hemolysin family protein [Mycoplasmopsis meleagridis]KUH47361.1 hemolysin C [Mycoplasmopsis meleagridis]
MNENPSIYWLIIPILLLIICSSFFSAAETAYTTLNIGKIETLVNKKAFGAKLIKKQFSFFNQTLVTLLICNNVVNIASSALLSSLLAKALVGNLSNYVALFSTLVMTPIIVLLGEITPKLIAKYHPINTAQVICYPLSFFYYLFWIFTYPISKIGKKIYITNTEEDLKNIIDVAQNEGVLETNESIMAQNALDLDSIKVKKHYFRLKDVVSVNVNSNISETLDVFVETNYSRLPVINNEGQFIGIVLLKDIFHLQRGKISNFIKTVPTISSNISLSKALEILRLNKAQMAFVSENNSSTKILGIITIEDILEEIVGEIYDEYDQDEWKDILEVSLELYHINSNVKISQIIRKIGIELDIREDEKNLSLKDFLVKRTGKKISKNLNYSLNDITFFHPKKNPKNDTWTIELSLGNNADFRNRTIEETIIHDMSSRI